jgi:SAM-dependent methyltransferase
MNQTSDIRAIKQCVYCLSDQLTALSYESKISNIPAGLTRNKHEIFRGFQCKKCYSFFKTNTESLLYNDDYSKSETYNSEHVLAEQLEEYPYSLEILKYINFSESDTILEIGAGSGWLSRYLVANGYNNIHAVEKDSHYLSLLQASGVSASIDIPNKKFDIIIFVGLYEHLEDPINFVRTLYSNHLEQDGQLFFQYPNPTSISARLNPAGWDMLFEPGHIEMPSAIGVSKAFSSMKLKHHSSTITTRGRLPFTPMRLDSLEKKWNKLILKYKFFSMLNTKLFKLQDCFGLGETLNILIFKK